MLPRLMAKRQIRRLPVVENGRLIGMVSLGDIAVKHGERTAGDALESVSHGVKGRGGRANPPAGRNRSGSGRPSEERAAALRQRAAFRQEQERTGTHLVTGGTGAPQGISNHDIVEERTRQEKVVPFRNQGKTTRRRNAS